MVAPIEMIEKYFLEIIRDFFLIFSFSGNNAIFGRTKGSYKKRQIIEYGQIGRLMVVCEGKLCNISGLQYLSVCKTIIRHRGTTIFPIYGGIGKLVRPVGEYIVSECGRKKEVLLSNVF